MHARLRAALLTSAIAVGLMLPAGALPLIAPATATANPIASDTMSFVGNVAYKGGTDIEFATLDVDGAPREFAFAGTLGNGMQIVDITDPENAEIAGVYDCGIAQGDVQIFVREDLPGRTFATYTMDTGYSADTTSTCYQEADALGQFVGSPFGSFIVDVTDPSNPTTVSFVPVAKGSHNQTVHPRGEWMYNSNSELITNARNAAIEVVDLRDLANPKIAGTLPIVPIPGLGTDSHDITFSADGTRAYSAALSHTLIIDTLDPAKPSVVGRIIDPAINVEHQANPITITDPVLGKRDFLIVEDEVGGATGTGQCPNGGVHVYDITGDLERAPVKVGYWNIAEVRTMSTRYSCTAHVFQLHPEQGLMTIAYYNGGTRVVDLSGLVGVALGGEGVGMREVGSFRFADSNAWSAKTNLIGDGSNFYVYANDIDRGLDVLRFQADGGATQAAGTGEDRWLTPAQALAKARVSPASPARPYCLLPQ
jgi:hypothetical protein